MADYYTVLDSFVGALHPGEEVEYRKGEVVAASDPGLKKWPHLFGPLVVRGQVEQATAAPGEKRTLTKRLGRPPKAKAAPAPAPEPVPIPAGKPLTSASFRPGGGR